MDTCWHNAHECDIDGIINLNKVFGDKLCKIVWPDGFDYNKYTKNTISELINLTTDKSSLSKTLPITGVVYEE